MSRERQIEEIARKMCHLSAECKTCQICNERYHGGDDLCYFQCVAKEIVNHGYRKQEWISVNEMAPKKWQKCLCYYPEKDYGSKVVVDYAETDNGGFAEQFQFGKPFHWMPIPEAPATDIKDYPPYLDRPKGFNFQKEKGSAE